MLLSKTIPFFSLSCCLSINNVTISWGITKSLYTSVNKRYNDVFPARLQTLLDFLPVVT